MEIQRLPFMGQLRGHRVGSLSKVSSEEEVAAARDSLYFWWWRFLKESDEYQRAAAGDLVDEPWASVAADFENPRSEFDLWWHMTGRKLFSEQVFVPKVRKMAAKEVADYRVADTLFVAIPLTIRRKTILRQVNRLLEADHPKTDLCIYRHSTARRRIYPNQRIRMTTFPTLLKVWHAAKASPGKQAWEIGEELKLSPFYIVVDGDDDDMRKHKHRMMSVTVQRLQRRAKALIDFAAKGDFPRFK